MEIIYLLLPIPILKAVRDVTSKALLSDDVPPLVVAWLTRLCAVPFLVPALFVIGVPKLGTTFFVTFPIVLALGFVANVAYYHALKRADVSLVAPLLASSPLFTAIAGALIIGEYPSGPGLIGITAIVAGCYGLNLQDDEGVIEPFVRLTTSPWSLLVLLTVLCYSLNPPLEKIGIGASGPFFWALTAQAALALTLQPLASYRADRSITAFLGEHPWGFALIGLCSGSYITLQLIGFTQTLVVYPIVIKRLAALLSVIGGGLLLKEARTTHRFGAATAIVVGSILVLMQA